MLALRSGLHMCVGRIPRGESSIWLIPILVVAGALRFCRIGANSLWFDEAFSWLVAQHSASAIAGQSLVPIMPPMYHLLLHFWLHLGQSEVVLRSFSAFCGLLGVLVVYVVGRELLSRKTGLAASALMAVLPFQVYFAQETRPYALVVLLSAAVLWAFAVAYRSNRWQAWVVLGVSVALHLCTHYFVAFTLMVLHAFTLAVRPPDRSRWRGLILADLVALALAGPHLPSAWARTQRVIARFWLSLPSPLQPFKTLDYLLFGHTTPTSLVPAALFLSLSVLALVVYSAVRTHRTHRQWLLLLLALVMTPILIALLLSWLIAPVYLDRSFSLVTPAYILLLGWGLAHPPRGSPVWILFGGLVTVVVISLGNHYINPDPAKPPFREVGAIVCEHWREGDVLFHIHDSSYLPLQYYAPRVESYLLNNDPDAWLPPSTWEWAGRRVSSLDEAVSGRERMWVVVPAAEFSERQVRLLEQIDLRYACEKEWIWDKVKLKLCSLREARAS